MSRIFNFNSVPNELLTTILVVVVAVILAIYVPCPWLNEESVATLTGAVIGALAVFIGNLQNQRAQKQLAENASREKASKIRSLICQDLYNVALGLSSLRTTLSAAITSASAQQQTQSLNGNLQKYLPREMVCSNALIQQFIELRSDELQALIKVFNGLNLTRQQINDSKSPRYTKDNERLWWHTNQDLNAIKSAVEQLDPEFQITITGESSPKLLTTFISEQLAEPADKSRYAED